MSDQKIENCPFCKKECDCTPDVDSELEWSVYCCPCDGCQGCGYTGPNAKTWIGAVDLHNRVARAVLAQEATSG